MDDTLTSHSTHHEHSTCHLPASATEATGLKTTETVILPSDFPSDFVLPSISSSNTRWSTSGWSWCKSHDCKLTHMTMLHCHMTHWDYIEFGHTQEIIPNKRSIPVVHHEGQRYLHVRTYTHTCIGRYTYMYMYHGTIQN